MKVNKNGPIPKHVPHLGTCWMWIGSVATDGYGKLKSKIGNRLVNERAHRVSWEIHEGKIPKGLWVLHKCDTLLCVRRSHLFLGNGKDNVADMISKGRQHYNPVRKLTYAQVAEIRNTKPYYGYQSRLAEKFDVTSSVVSEIVAGKTWKSLTI